MVRRIQIQTEEMKLILLLIACACFTGCARMTEVLHSTITSTNGTVEVRDSKASGWVFGDSKNSLDKMRVSNGKTHSIGLSGMEQETTTTNIAASLDAMTRLIQSVK